MTAAVGDLTRRWSAGAVYVSAFLRDYARNPVNVLLLVLVPTVFVGVVAGTLADAAKLLGGTGGPAVETATAGWAAGFLAGVAMYFQVAGGRDTDRRLVLAGLPAHRLALARLVTGFVLALGASTAALLTLAVRAGVDTPGRVLAGTVMFAVIYLAVGALAGVVAPNPVNGTVIVLFVWIMDVFFGPVMGAADRLATRGLPTHFVTLWMVDLPSRHGGRVGDLGWAVGWSALGALLATALIAARVRVVPHPRGAAAGGSSPAQLAAAVRAVWRDDRRNPVQWVLVVVVPLVFVLAADAVTPNQLITLKVQEGGRSLLRAFRMPEVHGATMAPIAITALAALLGLFAVLDSRDGDRRVALAGMRPLALLTARLTVLSGTVLAASAVTLAVTSSVFTPMNWPAYAAANILLGLTYALVGALLAPLVGRVGGVFLAFLLPFLDLGVTQSPMLHPEPSTLARLLPGYGGSRLLLDGALTRGVDESAALLTAGAWLAVLVLTVAWAYWQGMPTTRAHGQQDHHARTRRQASRAPVGG